MLKSEQQRKETDRIGDFDELVNEIIGVLMTTHLCNVVSKFKLSAPEHRRDAFYSAKLAATVCFQIIAEKKVYWKQLE